MNRERNYSLDLWKFVFAVLVVLFHANNMVDDASQEIFVNGRLAVEFFFIVSGCMMAMSARRREELALGLGQDTFGFIKGKFFSLMPNVIVGYAIAFIVFHYNGGETSLRTMGTHLAQSLPDIFLLKQTGIKIISYNGVTWYLSAMLLTMAILYPMLRKWKETFFYIIAPLGFLLIMGYLFQTHGSLSNLEEWNGWTFNGNLRAMADILGGVICYQAVCWLGRFSFKKLMKVLFTVLEWACYIGVIWYTFDHKPGQADYLLFFFLMVGVTVTVSKVSYSPCIFRHKFFGWLGKYSFSLYLGHSCWRKYISNIYPDSWGFEQKLAAYLVLAALTGLVIMYVSLGLRALWKKVRPKVVSLLIEKKTA